MRWIVWIVLWIISLPLYAQSTDSLALGHSSVILSPFNHPEVKYKPALNPVVFVGKTALFCYQKIISDQIGAICAHEPSCSEYCRQSIENSGFIRGVLLSGDRLQRCTPFNVMYLRKKPENLHNGKIHDPPIALKSKKRNINLNMH